MESSTSRPQTQSSQALVFFVGHGSYQHAFHLLSTKPAARCHTGYVMSLVVIRRNGVRSVVGFGPCKFQRREGSKPIHVSPLVTRRTGSGYRTHPHSSIQSACDLIVLLQSWATPQDFWQPELANGTLHVPNPSLSWWRCFDPLCRFSSHSTYHIRMSESLGSPLIRLDVERRGNGLCDTGMERGSSTWDHQRVFAMVACGRSLSVSVPSSRTGGEGVS